MGAGLGLDRPVGWRRWAVTWRLLGIVMPLSIAAAALLGSWLLGLAPAAALLLGAALAPTDPVLAGEVQVGEPATEPVEGEDLERAEDEVRFGLTSEAGLNDGLAFPFVYAAIALAEQGSDLPAGSGSGSVRRPLQDQVGLPSASPSASCSAGSVLPRRVELRLAEHRRASWRWRRPSWPTAPAEVAQGYGFLAVFVRPSPSALRAVPRLPRGLHSFIEQVERLLTVLVLLLLGMALSDGLLAGLGGARSRSPPSSCWSSARWPA